MIDSYCKKELFKKLYKEYYETVHKYILVSLNYNYDAANDCMQDVLIILLQKIDKVLEHPNPGGFFIVTARNFIKKYKVSIANNARMTMLYDENTITNSYEETFSNLLEKPVDIELLKKDVLSRLKDSEILIYEMFYEERHSIAEISKRLHITESNVKVKLFRLRIKVKEMIRELFAD